MARLVCAKVLGAQAAHVETEKSVKPKITGGPGSVSQQGCTGKQSQGRSLFSALVMLAVEKPYERNPNSPCR